MSFPLVCLPRRFAYVEDDPDFLDILRMTLPRGNSRRFFESPQIALMALKHEAQYWDWLTDVFSRTFQSRTEGKGEAAMYVNSYFSDWRRFNLSGVLVIDNSMPGMNGIQLIERLEPCPSRRILLTGAADSAFAIKAFNSGQIHRFIPKSNHHLYQEITRCTEEMHSSLCEHFSHFIRPTMSADQFNLLNHPGVILFSVPVIAH